MKTRHHGIEQGVLAESITGPDMRALDIETPSWEDYNAWRMRAAFMGLLAVLGWLGFLGPKILAAARLFLGL